jgi:glycosyltransferase involved in cell wall biosynthesis
MSNAAIYFHPNGFDTSGPALVGRHSAGESFLRGYFRHADVDQHVLWNVAGRPAAELEKLLHRIEPPRHPVRWVSAEGRADLGVFGVLNLPTPQINEEAWRRMPFGSRRYALTGITHTIATQRAMNLIPEYLISPVEDFDALICTSTAVRSSVETQLEMMRDYMRQAYGERRRPEPQRVTIPLGVNASDFAPSAAARKAWRERLDIPEDAIVALYVGRFSVKMKMNPALMATALERAARRTGKPVYWVTSGWVEPERTEEIFHGETRKLCPSVEYRTVDGRQSDVRFSIWSVADFFISFSDNIQETFGLTPIEAMAAGLPCVVSDWNGYKDTVRDGIDGFRIPTISPGPGFGGDLAYGFGNNWLTYDNYVGATAQYTAIDMAAAENALVSLIENGALRRTMGRQARVQAQRVFDWAAIIPQYQGLWAEQNARRKASTASGPTANPYRPDPYRLFANYPTRHLQRSDIISLSPEMDPQAAKARLAAPLAAYSRFNRPTDAEVEIVISALIARGPTAVAELLESIPEPRRRIVERGLLWLARHDVVVIQAP